jgi:glycosyltransferase involved in cell wall biosynthesis
MRLLTVIHGPTFGGAHNQAMRLAGPLRDRGVETVALLPSEATSAAERLRAAGVEVELMSLSRLRATADPRPNLRLARSWRRELAAIAALIEARDIDVVQVHGPTNPQGAIAAQHSPGTAVVWQLLDTRTPEPLKRLLMPLVVRRADAITSWGEALAEAHPGARRLGARCTAVYPPVVAANFKPDAARRRQARARLGIASKQVLIATVGVLTPQKGHEHLIRAAAEVAARDGACPVAIRVLGAASPAHHGYRAALEREADELGLFADGRLDFVDPGDDVAELLQAVDLFALASVRRSEGMPTAVLEAMFAGKPVVATDVGAVRELVVDGETGLLVPPEQPAALAAALAELSDDGGRRQRLGAAGRARALAHFDLERLADLHLDAYRRALAHRRTR